MLPIIRIGSVIIPMYTLMVTMALLWIFIYVLSRRKETGLSVFKCVIFTLCCALTGLAETMMMTVFGNSNVFGAVILTPLVMPVFGKLLGLRAFQTRDMCAVGLAIDISFTKLGCFFAGCCQGIVLYIGSSYFQWPAQIIGCLAGFCILILLLRIEARGKWQGVRYPLLMLLYGIIRLILDSFEYMPDRWFGLCHGQCYGIVSAIIGAVWLIVHKRELKKQKRVPKILSV